MSPAHRSIGIGIGGGSMLINTGIHLVSLNSQACSKRRVFCKHVRGENSMKAYVKFGAMIATSTIVMFGLMYLNTYQWDHILFSQTRAYMAIVMGSAMAIIMLAFMGGMYTNRRVNMGIFAGSILIFVLALWLVRSQATVGEIAWMQAMIPHHSIAILTSERAHISDPRVRQLANGIIDTQRKEIDEMKALIKELEDR
jgi:hypothetical protein